MKCGRVYELYHKILDRLPSTYPKAVLTIYDTLEELHQYFYKYYEDDPLLAKGSPPNAFCDETYVVHIPLSLGDKQWTTYNLALHYLHEIGHLYALKKYGIEDLRWKDNRLSEKYADAFAYRWLRRLDKEGFFN